MNDIEELNIYSGQGIEQAIEDDELSAVEEGFMRGYIDSEDEIAV